jgi:hypothetical protein
MGLGHHGLSKLLSREGINVEELQRGDLIMFLNGRGDKLKVLGSKGWVVGYIRHPQGHRLMREAFQYLPQTFGADGFSYDTACRQALEARFRTYPTQRRTGPIQTQRARAQAGV